MYNILVVDDEPMIRRLISKYAQFEGHSVTEACDGMEALQLCRAGSFDIAVIDIMMPELDGFSTCREIRKFSDMPIIMLSARSEEYDRINGFELGVDDYVTKPFSPKELMLRINAIMKRYSERKTSPEDTETKAKEIYEFRDGKFSVDMTARTVCVSGKRVELTPKEYDLLFYLIRNRNIALTRSQILSEVWGFDYFGDDRTLDTHIKLLRKSIGRNADMIVTVRGVGYRFEDK